MRLDPGIFFSPKNAASMIRPLRGFREAAGPRHAARKKLGIAEFEAQRA